MLKKTLRELLFIVIGIVAAYFMGKYLMKLVLDFAGEENLAGSLAASIQRSLYLQSFVFFYFLATLIRQIIARFKTQIPNVLLILSSLLLIWFVYSDIQSSYLHEVMLEPDIFSTDPVMNDESKDMDEVRRIFSLERKVLWGIGTVALVAFIHTLLTEIQLFIKTRKTS